MKRGLKAGAWVLPVVIATLSLAARIVAVWPTPARVWADAPKRFWEDMHLATGYYLRGEFPVFCNDVVKTRGPEGIGYTERFPQLSRSVDDADVKTWQFWRTVSARRFLRHPDGTVSTRFDDSGRPLLLGLVFRAMGGISPFLLLWIAFALLVPVLLWTAWEFRARGEILAGSVFLIVSGLSAYIAENLALSYSPSGFYVVSLYALVALTVYATAPVGPLGLGHWVRILQAGLVFGVCALGRGGTLLQIAGFILAIGIAVWRRTGDADSRSLVRVATPVGLSLVLFALPYLVLRIAMDQLIASTLVRYGDTRVPQQHALWFGIWGGLGDFDETKGHVWNDFATWDAIVKAGGVPVTPTYYDPKNEAILRSLVLNDIQQDPAWYLGIVGRRLWATVLQTKLWPWRPLSGLSTAPSQRPNEGAIDSYYSLTSTADFFGVGSRLIEVPIPVLLLPTGVLLFAALRRRRFLNLLPLVPVLGAVLPLPLFVTTASALEPQALIVAYILGGALIFSSHLGTKLETR